MNMQDTRQAQTTHEHGIQSPFPLFDHEHISVLVQLYSIRQILSHEHQRYLGFACIVSPYYFGRRSFWNDTMHDTYDWYTMIMHLSLFAATQPERLHKHTFQDTFSSASCTLGTRTRDALGQCMRRTRNLTNYPKKALRLCY